MGIKGIKGMIFMGRELLPVQASSLDFVARLGSPSWSGLHFLSSFISSIHPTFVVAPSIQATWTAIQVCFSRCLESPACPHTTWRQLASSTASSSGVYLNVSLSKKSSRTQTSPTVCVWKWRFPDYSGLLRPTGQNTIANEKIVPQSSQKRV